MNPNCQERLEGDAGVNLLIKSEGAIFPLLMKGSSGYRV